MYIISKLLTFVLNFIIFVLCTLIPNTDKIWIFGSWFGETFSDNTKYLFLYCSKHKEELNLDKVIWITKNEGIYKELKLKGFEVLKKWSIKSIWYHIMAKYHFICQSPDDINPYFSVKAKRIQLWHGVGLKNLSSNNKIPNKNNLSYKVINFLKLIFSKGCWNKYIFLSTSEFASENIFKYSFKLWENKYFEANYPRNIYLNNFDIEDYYLDKNQIEIIDYIKNQKDNFNISIVLYTPTYRNEDNSKYPLNINSKDEIEYVMSYFKEKKIIFLNKSHFINKSHIVESRYFFNLESKLDIYPILKYVDILITDYSSIYADFLFINKPIIFYPYDFDYYSTKDKGFLLDYKKFVPGDIVFDIKSLISSIEINLNSDNYLVKREQIKNLYFGDNIEQTMLDFINKLNNI